MLIASLPVTALRDSLTELPDCIDAVEIRLDYRQFINDDTVTIPFSIPKIYTWRDTNEGGVYPIELIAKLALYQRYQAQEYFVDLEAALYNDQCSQLDPSKLIISRHIFESSCNWVMVEHTIIEMLQIPAAYYKLAIRIDNYCDLVSLMRVLQQYPAKWLITGIGKLGHLVRVLAMVMEIGGTYVGIAGQETAPGQLTTIQSIIYRLKSINRLTAIGGIIGGEQVQRSIGISYYNSLFSERNINAVYLPFPVESIEDFQLFFNWASEVINLYGFSVTMPFKKTMSSLFSNDREIINLSTNIKQKWNTDLTDRMAFLCCKEYLNMQMSDSILVLGAGAMAELAIETFSGMKIYLSARNKTQAAILLSNSTCSWIEWGDRQLEYDFVINATPCGQDGVPVEWFDQLVINKGVIDLPYGETTTQIIKKAQYQSLPYVDGQQFWQWQAEEQSRRFLLAIQAL